MSDFNSMIIEEFRANGGQVTTAGFGDRLVLLHTTGAKTGAERVSPLMGLPTDDGWLVAASKGGAPEEPGWAHNLRVNPRAAVETGTATVDAVAAELDGADHDAGWARFLAASPSFATYQERAGRKIAVFHLVRATA
ncbi:nitroreductase/quinone reductase family protein [uncultured Microbacterium sp.]|uniref:nitroreductase/quinone reductase family protein n=1 Tax=uncultured Microbacterium sp. TaxID=191216 RepID=UPI0035CABE91